MQDFSDGWYPVNAPQGLYAGRQARTNVRLSPEIRKDLIVKNKNRSLRQLAKEYGVSHETVRSALKAASEHQRRGLSVEGADGVL